MKRRCLIINLRKAAGYIARCLRPFSQDRITVYAAQASFYISISAIPFIMILLHFVQLILPEFDTETLSEIIALLPPVISDTVRSMLDELFGKVSFSVLSFSTLTLLWTASKGVKSIGNGVRHIFGSRADHGYVSNLILSMLQTLGFVVFMTASFALLMFGRRILHDLPLLLPLSDNMVSMLYSLRIPIFFGILILLFWSAYHGMSRIKSGWRVHLPGAVFSAIGWLLFSLLYTVYIDHFPSSSYIYGSLTAIVLLMLWLYFCVIIFLLGAEINKLLIIKQENAAK